MEKELAVMWLGLVAYVLAGSCAVILSLLGRRLGWAVLAMMLSGLVLHGFSLGLRWERLGHGPFVNQFEIISSNLWSLTLVYGVVYWRIPGLRTLASVVLPTLFILMGWLLVVDPLNSEYPPTYNTVWLYVHIGFGKVFLGAALVAAALGVVVLLRALAGGLVGRPLFSALPVDDTLDEVGYRFLALAFVFDTLMIVAGAIWAQDAWGRYWSWDPLEVWSLINWLLVTLALHLRPTFDISPRVGGVVGISVFVVAFVNFFGVPFLSRTMHQGVF
ncbi:MAG: cytochrome c biogenesis protein CcsA [Magnetococcales bacterium]|nr:cytochrome c biogenesis protein CcsA [Magnetococcales bacterium]